MVVAGVGAEIDGVRDDQGVDLGRLFEPFEGQASNP
jgi:hypothetical protein